MATRNSTPQTLKNRPNLQAVPAPRDALIASLRQKLSRLFSGVSIKNVYGSWHSSSQDLDCRYIGLTAFGSEADLIRCGLVTEEMLRSLPPSGAKAFRGLPHLGNTGLVHVKRGKTGTRFGTFWWCVDEEWRGAPAWILSELRSLAEMSRSPEGSSDAPCVRKEFLAPADWKAAKAAAFGTMVGLAGRCTLSTDTMFESLGPGWRINPEDQRRFEKRVDEVIAELKDQLLAIRFDACDGPRQETPCRRLRLVIDND